MHAYNPNNERLFHQILMDATPLLFLAPIEYREQLVVMMNHLYNLYRSGDSQFGRVAGSTHIFITDADGKWDSKIKEQIGWLQKCSMSFDERLVEIENKIGDRLIGKKKKKVLHDVKTNKESEKNDNVNKELKKSTKVVICDYIKNNPGCLSKTIKLNMGINDGTLRVCLLRLVKEGTIVREGDTRNKYIYRIAQQYKDDESIR